MTGSCGCKIGRNVESYRLEGLDQTLRQRHEQGASLRDLEAFVNVRILEASLDAADADVAGDAESIYSALTDEDVPTERRVRIQDQLAGLDVDLDALESDFVSYQTIRSHLRNCLEMDTGRDGIESLDEGWQIIARVTDRERQIIERTLNRLRRIGVLGIGNVNVTVTVTAECERCGRSHRVMDLLERGQCECHDRE